MSASPNAANPRAALSGLVLCGGQSARMGRDKAQLELAGRSLVARAADVLQRVCGEVWLACGSSARYAELGLPLALDSLPGAGPLSGLHSGLERARTPWLAVLACDMPGVEPEVFEALLAEAQRRDLDACLLATAAGLEPLCAVYHTACAGAAAAALAAGERKLTSFHTGFGSRALRIGALEALRLAPEGDEIARNLNTPQQYRDELRRAHSACRGCS